LQEVVAIGTTYNLPVARTEWQPFLGIITLYSGNATEARRLLEESLRLCLEVRNSDYWARTCMCLAEMALWEGEPDQAAHWLRQSLAYEGVRQRLTIDELQRLFITVRLLAIQGQYRRAATLMGLIEVEHRRIHDAYQGPMLPLVNAARIMVRAALGVEAFDEAFATGQRLSLGEAYDVFLTSASMPTALQSRE
jgi:ATP/maltotriose-dependent transcriptional regulator MalT